MEPRETQRLMTEFACLGEYYRQPLSDQVCTFYAQDLSDLPYAEVHHAMHRMRQDPKRRFVPMPAEVREMATPPDEGEVQAVDLAARISSAISKFGYTGQNRAKMYIGDIGWDVVERLGGWQPLCQTLTSAQMGTFYAQTREMCRVALQQASFAKDRAGQNLLKGGLGALLSKF